METSNHRLTGMVSYNSQLPKLTSTGGWNDLPYDRYGTGWNGSVVAFSSINGARNV